MLNLIYYDRNKYDIIYNTCISNTFPTTYSFQEIVIFGNHQNPIVSLHFNESGLMEMFIWTVGAF